MQRKFFFFNLILVTWVAVLISCQNGHIDSDNRVTPTPPPNLTLTAFKSLQSIKIDEGVHLVRIESLLAFDRTGRDFVEQELVVPIEAIGAIAGGSYKSVDPEIWFAVYEFERQLAGEDQAILDQLEASLPAEDLIVMAAWNGPLLFYGYAYPTGDELYDKFHPLKRVVSAFAGDE